MKANELKVLRLSLKISATVMSKKLGISKAYLSLLENGERPITKALETRIRRRIKYVDPHRNHLLKVAERKLNEVMKELQLGPASLMAILAKQRVVSQVDDPHVIFEKKLEDKLDKLDLDIKELFNRKKLIKELVDKYEFGLKTVVAIHLRNSVNSTFEKSLKFRTELSMDYWDLTSYLWPEEDATRVNEQIRTINWLLFNNLNDPFYNFEKSKKIDPRLITSRTNGHYKIDINEAEKHRRWSRIDDVYPWVYFLNSYFIILKSNLRNEDDIKDGILLQLAADILKSSPIHPPLEIANDLTKIITQKIGKRRKRSSKISPLKSLTRKLHSYVDIQNKPNIQKFLNRVNSMNPIGTI